MKTFSFIKIDTGNKVLALQQQIENEFSAWIKEKGISFVLKEGTQTAILYFITSNEGWYCIPLHGEIKELCSISSYLCHEIFIEEFYNMNIEEFYNL